MQTSFRLHSVLVTPLAPTPGKFGGSAQSGLVIEERACPKSLTILFAIPLYRTHTAPHLLTGPMMEEELDKTEEAMVKILGVKPKLYMPPYGIIDTKNANVSAGFEVLHKRGYTST